VLNSTIAGNVAGLPGGGLNNGAGTVQLQNTLLARNTAYTDSGTGADCAGVVTSLGDNLLGDPTGCTMTLLATDLTGDPGLDAFTDHGTPGNGHFPLLPESPAIDAGHDAACPETDQLGQPRVGPCDSGAIEFQPLALTVVIDIRPRSRTSLINPKSPGTIPVAIVTTTTVDATTVNPATVRFGATGTEAAPVQALLTDVNGDGHLDLLLRFDILQTGISSATLSASLTGQTFSQQAIKGSASIHTVGCHVSQRAMADQ
jgi:hypothetical protein